jgi:DNA adenine methylase
MSMKPPISYYGGKQKLASTIVPLIPQHNLYCEPFFGGGAIFFTKERSNVEVINDTNSKLINFYRLIQQDFRKLKDEIEVSLHSRKLHKHAQVVNANPELFDPIKRAWAVWVLANQSFSSMLDGSWGYDKKKPSTSRKISNKREQFNVDMAVRLQEVQIECTDALRVMAYRDTPEAFFYLDPPYYNSDCGHYDGYTLEDFEMLLQRCCKLEGKFLLSSYPSDILAKYTKEQGWHQIEIEQRVTVALNSPNGRNKTKTEVLTANYPLK